MNVNGEMLVRLLQRYSYSNLVFCFDVTESCLTATLRYFRTHVTQTCISDHSSPDLDSSLSADIILIRLPVIKNLRVVSYVSEDFRAL